jgi:hypothetical protein
VTTKFKSYPARLSEHGLEVFHSEDYTGPNLSYGYYWWSCQPGCLPDGDGEPNGPYATYNDAARAALDGLDD